MCYDQIINPINSPMQWPKTNDVEILPPMFKQGPGRPKRLRRRELDEPPNPTKLRRSHTTNKCRRCHTHGRNSRRCPLPPSVVEETPQTEVNGSATQPAPITQEQPNPASQAAPTSEQQPVPASQGAPTSEKQPASVSQSQPGPTKSKSSTCTLLFKFDNILLTISNLLQTRG